MNLSTYFLCFLWLAVSSAAPPEIEKAISVTDIGETSAIRPVPVVPSSVSVTHISTICATVKWGKVITGEIHGYIITLTPRAGRSPFDIRDRSTSEMKLTELIPATKYNVTFQTYSSYEYDLMRSDEVSIHFTTARPDINITSITSTNATASWTKSPGIFDYYNITSEGNQSRCKACLHHEYHAGNEIIANNKTVPSTMTSPTVKLLGLVPGNTYRVHVWTVNGSTEGLVRSSEWFQAKPAAVAGTSISVLSVTTNSATLTWRAVTVGNADNYTITTNPTLGGANAYPSVVNNSYRWRFELGTKLRSLTSGTEYNITIRSNYGAKESEPATIKFQTRPNPVDATSIRLSEITTFSARVTWRAASGNIDSYIIAVSEGRADPSTVANDTLTTTLRGLAAGREYTVTIKTIVGTVDGTTVTRNFVTRPSAVKKSSIEVEGITTVSATLTWGAVSDGKIDYYSFLIRQAQGGTDSSATVEPSKVYPAPAWVISRPVALRGLAPGTEYTITIKTKYGQLESDPVEFNFTTELIPVDAASIFLTNIGENSAKVTWDSVDGNFDHYIISIRPTTGGANVEPDKVAKGLGVLSTDLKNLTPGSFYIVTIRTVKGSKNGPTAHQVFQTRDPNHTRGLQASTSGSTNPATTSKATTPVVSLPATSTTSKATTPGPGFSKNLKSVLVT